MRKPLHFVLVVVLVLFAFAVPAAAQSELFPQDTFLYVEADAATLQKGLPDLAVAKALKDPELARFLAPAIEGLGLGADPAAGLLAQVPIGQFVTGKAAFGIRGFSLALRDGDFEARCDVSPAHPLDARMAYTILGLLAREDNPDVEVAVDAAAVVDAGPMLRALVAGLEQETVRVGSRDVTHFKLDPHLGFGDMDLYGDLSGARWIVATRKETLRAMLEQGGGGRPLPAVEARRRFCGENGVLLFWLDFQALFQMVKSAIPPLISEMNEINGLAAVRGVGYGMSLDGGGVRESLGLMLTGRQRKGVWTLLDAFPGGLRACDEAPPGALGAIVVKFDAQLFYQRLMAVTAELLPGTEGILKKELGQDFNEAGLDLEQQVLPAFGDEIALFVYPGPMPDWVVQVRAGDMERLQALVAKARASIPDSVARFQDVDLGEGAKAVRVFAPLPFDTMYALQGERLVIASRGPLLKEALAWAGGAAGERDLLHGDEVLVPTLKALTGGETDGLAALAYVNLRGVLGVPMLWQAEIVPKEVLNPPAGMGEVNRLAAHFGGAAVGLRCDEAGVALDTFSPVGMVLPGLATAALTARRVVVAQQVAFAQPRAEASLGIRMRSSEGNGVVVLAMFEEGPVQKAGLRPDDTIVAFEGRKIASIEDLDRELGACNAGDKVEITVRRGAATVTNTVELGQ